MGQPTAEYNRPPMAAPTTIPRSEHTLSKQQVDDDALKIIYRLQQHDFETYLVGGGVRDLLLDRRPKDFDLGTSAHPQQIKRLFRNCWIIGRRFRLAHIKFGEKTLEVATFRKQVPPETDTERAAREAERERARRQAEATGTRAKRVIPRDNTFGNAEEDAFRRDFTINALFYDAATRSILDYVDGMRDIRSRTIRSIGDPNERFVEDPVRMLRAVVLAARLDLSIDSAVTAAIRRHRGELVHSSPARLVEELYKIARSGAAERIIRDLGAIGLLEYFAPELDQARSDALWRSLAALDRYRRRFDDIPTTLGNALTARQHRLHVRDHRATTASSSPGTACQTAARSLPGHAADRQAGPRALPTDSRPTAPTGGRTTDTADETRRDTPVGVHRRPHLDGDSRTDSGTGRALAERGHHDNDVPGRGPSAASSPAPPTTPRHETARTRERGPSLR